MLATTLTVLLIIVALGGVIGTALWWHANRTADVRRVLVELRRVLQDSVAVGGLEAPAFLAADSQNAEQELEDLIGRVNDRKLPSGCRRVLEGYRRTWASAPPRQGPRAYVAGSPPSPHDEAEDRQRAEQMQRQVNDARSTLDAIEVALARLNVLERLLPRRD